MKILITSTSFGKKDSSPIRLLESRGYEITWNETGKPLQPEELISRLEGCTGVIAGLDYFTSEVFERVNGLKVVSRYGVGVDRVDIDAAQKAGVIVTNTPTANSDSVADLAIALMLAVARKIPEAHSLTLSGQWPKPYGVSLYEKTLGLIGLGRIGSRVAKRAKGFDCEVLVYDPFIDIETAGQFGTRKVETLEELLYASDFISLHLPAGAETNGLINRAVLTQMKPNAILINTSRGELIVEDDLLDALKNGTILGAGLDAHAQEPPDVSKYEGVPNLILSPHMGAYTDEALYNMAMDSANDLIAVLEGKKPLHRIA